MGDDEIIATLRPRLDAVRSRIAAACARVGRDPKEVTLVAVTKTVSARVAGCLPRLGVHNLGESRPQELWRKAEALRGRPVLWHLIGHVQRNKIDRTLPEVSLFHSIDSERLLAALAAAAAKLALRPRILMQANISRELQKQGFSLAELSNVLPLCIGSGLELAGLMGMAALGDDPEQSRPAFRELRQWRDKLAASAGCELPHLSMGMSGDFEVAIEEGATIVRLGTVLFDGMPAAD